MILIDSIYINNGGGLVLLKYLIDTLEKNNVSGFYLFDKRTEDFFSYISREKCIFLESTLYARINFYSLNKENFSSVLCFGNIPPLIKLKVPVYTYFHQLLFLEVPSDFSLRNKVIYFIKQNILNFCRNNTDYWLVQSELIQNNFAIKYLKGDKSKVIVLPFYPSMNFSRKDEIKRLKNHFLYVSNTSPHKNHRALIEAFCQAFDEVKQGSLTLTIPDTDIELLSFLKLKVSLGYPIVNIGFIERNSLVNYYLANEYLIFPSLAESFGLGLAEAIDAGCKVIAADLPYTYQVCKPSLTFDPTSIESIKSAIIFAIVDTLPSSEKRIDNDIRRLIELLT